MPDLVILLNVVWIVGIVIFAVFYYRREERRKKAAKAAKQNGVSAAFEKRRRSYARQYLPLPAGDFPDLKRDGFVLVDLAEVATHDPPEPPLPKLSDKRAIEAGDLVRALLLDGQQEEAETWITIVGVLSDDCFAGQVHQVDDATLQHLGGQALTLHANHIAEIVRIPAADTRH